MPKLDFLDPRTWDSWMDEAHEFRIYADDNVNVYAVVDEIDYHYLIQWRWSVKYSGRYKEKLYLRRNAHKGTRKKRRQITLLMHVVIMQRTGIKRPTPHHTLTDHRNGDSLYCRRANLRWATHVINTSNKRGSMPDDEPFEDPFVKQCSSCVVG